MAETVMITRELYGAGSVKIEINPGDRAARHLRKRGNIVVIDGDPHKSAIIQDAKFEETREKSLLTVNAMTLNSMFAKRVTVPPDEAQVPGSLGYDRISAPAETVLKHYATRHIDGGAFDPKRAIPGLIIADDLGRGAVMPAQARYTPTLEDMSMIAKYAEMGFEIYPDPVEKRLIFDVIVGVDRSASQSDVSPVEISTANRIISQYSHVENYQNYRTTAYAGGAGQNEKRFITILGQEFEGFDREEIFLDCGSIDKIDDLRYYGGLKLAEYQATRTLDVTLVPNTFVFGEKYFLGDVVTVSIPKIELAYAARLEAVSEAWSRAAGYEYSARFGGKVPEIGDMVKKRQEVT